MMSKWDLFFKQIQQDFKLYVFTLVVFSLFRGEFIFLFRNLLSPSTSAADITSALYYGIRISLKSAGAITLLSFLFSTIPSVFRKNLDLSKVRVVLGCLYISILTLLFHIRIPYYEAFQVAFNQFLFNTFKDDINALFITAVQQYHLPLRLLSAITVSIMLCYLLIGTLRTKTISLPRFSYRSTTILFRACIIIGIILFAVFSRFGGSLSYAKSIHWENSVILKDGLLNEAILDDIQALYRAYDTHETLKKAAVLNITSDKVKVFGSNLYKKPLETDNIEDYLKKEAEGAKIPRPHHIFLIVGESYAQWPLLPKYENLNIANGMKEILTHTDATSVQAFLPTGTGTMSGINGIVTGLPEVNLYPNYQQESYRAPYATSIGLQMKRLGYRTRFWYNGFASWQRIKEFVLAQGFDEFFSCSDFSYQAGNAWGSEDKYFFEGIQTLFSDEQSSFNVILTSSNHPPFTVNVVKEGFDESTVHGLPEVIQKDKEWLNRLGHFWYADHFASKFIQIMQQQYPGSLFVITGDHADRMNINSNTSMFERYSVPFIVYGAGVTKNLFRENVSGTHINITPTLIELIAPKGFEYYSIEESFTRQNTLSANYAFWINSTTIGETENNKTEDLLTGKAISPPVNLQQAKERITEERAIAWWRIKKGKDLN